MTPVARRRFVASVCGALAAIAGLIQCVPTQDRRSPAPPPVPVPVVEIRTPVPPLLVPAPVVPETKLATTPSAPVPPVEDKRPAAPPPIPPPEEVATLSLGADAPWKVTVGDEEVPCPRAGGRLLPVLKLNAKAPKATFRLDLADIYGVDGRAPVGIQEFTVSLDCPDRLCGFPSAPSGWSVFWIEAEDWLYREPYGGGWLNLSPVGVQRQNLAPARPADATALGFYISLNSQAPPGAAFDGVVPISIERLALRLGPRPRPVLPEKGPVEESLETSRGWRPDPAYGGSSGVTHFGDAVQLDCDLDATDPRRLSAVAELSFAPRDMREQGVFLTVDVPRELVAPGKFKAGLHVGVLCQGGVQWGPWLPLTVHGPVVVAVYPETRFPLPMSFRTNDFDASKADGIAVRVTVDQATDLRFRGGLIIRKAEIVRAPQTLVASRNRIAQNLDERFPAPVPQEAKQARVDIRKFVANIGVDYPWPKDARGEGVYPVAGAHCWDSRGLEGGLDVMKDAIIGDFRWLAQHKVALARCWVFGDLRRGFVKDDHGTFTMTRMIPPCPSEKRRSMRTGEALYIRFSKELSRIDSSYEPKRHGSSEPAQCLSDMRVLLEAAEVAKIDLVPVLLDFSVADSADRERLGRVGDEPAILTDPKVRKQFIECIQPVIDLLSEHPRVRFIDLWNEPEQMSVPMDSAMETIAALAAAVRGRKPVTVGARNAVDMLFWMRAGSLTPTYHWFYKIDPRNLRAWAPRGIRRNATILTEVEATGGVGATLTEVWEAGFGGCLFWSVNAQDGISPFTQNAAEEFRRWVDEHLAAAGR